MPAVHLIHCYAFMNKPGIYYLLSWAKKENKNEKECLNSPGVYTIPLCKKTLLRCFFFCSTVLFLKSFWKGAFLNCPALITIHWSKKSNSKKFCINQSSFNVWRKNTFYFPLIRTRAWTRLEGGGRDVSLMYELNLHSLWRPVQGHVHSSAYCCTLLLVLHIDSVQD